MNNPPVTSRPDENTNPQAVDYNPSLVDSILSRGEIALLRGDISALELFETAEKLSPNDPDVFFRGGLALYDYGCNEGKEKILFLANKKFKRSTQLDPENLTGWHAWGNTLTALGELYEDGTYFTQAEQKYKKAIALSADESNEERAELYWDYANAWRNIGELSGESLDLRLALDAFEKASFLDEKLPAEFWIDHGNTYIPLGNRINDARQFVKAIQCFRKSVTLDNKNAEGWGALAEALRHLFSITHDEDTFTQTDECYAAATRLAPHEGETWYDWATFLLEAGVQSKDTRKLLACIEKCQRATSCDYEIPFTSAIWAEALSHLGRLSDRLDYLYEAENRASKACHLCPDAPEIWYSFGVCLNAMAVYFNDLDLHYQAIEKFQEGLSIDRTQHQLWHAMATTHAAISQMDLEPETFQKAYRFFNKSIELQVTSTKLYDMGLALAKFGELTNSQQCLEEAVYRFEQALSNQKNAIYLYPEWLFHYAVALDNLGDYYDSDSYYVRALEVLSHVMMVDPDFPQIHYKLALAYTHFGELSSECQHFYKAIHHFRLAAKREEDNDQIILDWGIALINLAEHIHDREEAIQIFRDAEHKIIQAAKLGNIHAYYHLGCLSSLQRNYEKAFAYIQKADSFDALPPVDEILDDEWLDGLRTYPSFQEFVQQLESRPQNLSQ